MLVQDIKNKGYWEVNFSYYIKDKDAMRKYIIERSTENLSEDDVY